MIFDGLRGGGRAVIVERFGPRRMLEGISKTLIAPSVPDETRSGSSECKSYRRRPRSATALRTEIESTNAAQDSLHMTSNDHFRQKLTNNSRSLDKMLSISPARSFEILHRLDHRTVASPW